MAFPLSSILNKRDVSPMRNVGLDNRTRDPTKLSTHPENSLTAAQTTSKSASYGELPTVILSPQRGALYNRRTTKSPRNIWEILQIPCELIQTPPESDDELESDSDLDDAPPTHELDFNGFNVFKALFQHPELIFELSKHLEVDELISLYAISKDFHYLVNARFTTMILGQCELKAKESSKVFRFKCYKNLCQSDPAKNENEEAKKSPRARDVPSLRWLQMVIHRENIVKEIIQLLGAEGLKLPRACSITLKKIWLTMDISDNARRIGIIHNKKFWTNKDLILATLFLFKLDMCLTDPMDGAGETGLRRMLMAQRGLSTLCQVLRREELSNQYDLLRMYTEWLWVPLPQHRQMEIFGVPPDQVGRLQYEGWGLGRRIMVRIDDLIMLEAIKRGLNLHERYVDMLLWGNIDSQSFKDVWPNEEPREIEGEWSDDEDNDNWDETEEEDDMDIDEFDLPG
ncbi:hypothetical protein MMC19_003540 [Ptychographa xylographoides]|nr:hypothetical protein [Ptychographa xylographoides]